MKDEILERLLELIAIYLRLGDGKGASIIKCSKQETMENSSENAIFLRELLWVDIKELLQKLHRL